MKKLLYTLILSSVLFGCKRTDDPAEELEGAKASVTFAISPFESEVIKLGKDNPAVSSSGDSLPTAADNLYYLVYNSSGRLVKSKTQTSNSTDFGKITDDLNLGTYTIYFLASKGTLQFDYRDYVSLHVSPTTNHWNDTFGKRLVITIDGSSVQREVKLERLVGGVEVEVQSAIPAGASYVEISSLWDAQYFRPMDSNYGFWVVRKKRYDLKPEDIGKTNMKFMFYTLNSGMRPVNVKCYDAQNKLIGNADAFVDCKPNVLHKLSGNIFLTSGAGFEISVDKSWPVTEVVQFY
jgi:hypothetical protein